MSFGPLSRCLVSLVVMGLASVAVVGATPPPTPTEPQPLPVRPGLPGTTREELGIDRSPPLLREGAFVASARGVLVRGQSGRWYVVFDRDARGRQMPPMVILPGQHLAAMERIASRVSGDAGTKTQVRVLVTGQAMAYQGHNYLLPTAPPILETSGPTASPTPSPAKVDPAEDEKPKSGDAAVGGEPSIEQIIGDLDRALGTKRATNPTVAADHEPPVSEASGVRVRPAGFMTARRGRVVRMSGGESTFMVDSGAAGDVAEPPMTLLPCTNLSVIETLAERLGESATFTISGQVTVYRGRNFLLPTTYTVNRATDQVIPNQ